MSDNMQQGDQLAIMILTEGKAGILYESFPPDILTLRHQVNALVADHDQSVI